MRKFASLFIVTLLIFPIGGASFIEDPIHKSSIPPNLGASAEESHSTLTAEKSDSLLTTSSTFPTGQGSMSFNFKAPSNGTATIQIYVKNNSSQSIRFILTAPNGTVWIDGEIIKSGQSLTSTYELDASQAGQWFMKFDNNDGSSITVDINTSYEI
ncbi:MULTISPECIES: hypothetical protein [Lysinibacillus]|uniref:hypothetical protein n=1 Tax=Lysinibacillus TaxID=400634 RepID=UPI00214B32F0|nr:MULTISPECIES: hypothetical protein [Lysinibacillus]UNT54342.1 hypothetical protein ICJ70_17700 [Lysinibacillus capsici]UUV25777.1 hypothetical protein NP781_03955 [Lysinibacillus sp. FN11]UYB48651.1 hypothetical protein OCI51_06755 [Lysinibacillus capsici]